MRVLESRDLIDREEKLLDPGAALLDFGDTYTPD